MNLVITTFGAYLHRKGEMFIIEVDKAKKEVSARKLRSILVSTGASLSSDAIKLAVENNIDIVFLDKFGQPYGRVWHGRPGSTTAIRRAQLRIADEMAGLELAKSWVLRKLDNQIEFFAATRKKRTKLATALTGKMDALSGLRDKLAAVDGDLESVCASIMGLEGKSGTVYWQGINLLLAEQYQFRERSRNPATDEFNCFLNYAYGVLYSLVERGCVLAGLDPYVGFVHTDDYNKKSLVFDLIECYRIWADETVVALFAAREVKQDMFRKLENGLLLDKPGKVALMMRFDAFLDEKKRYRNRNVMRREIIQLDCHRIANQLIGRQEDHEENANIGVDDL